ncbi:MAG: phasin family protein [Proteobacteria bacterium]|nr:phasin family protein [Pseudomonadota bacterium]
MASKVKAFVNEQAHVLAEQATRLRRAPGKAVRGVAAKSAKGIRALQDPVRVVTHSGVKLTNVSHEAVLSLMALQLEVVTSALSDAATQLERVAQSDNVTDLVRGQADELRAVRERVVSDVNRAVSIVRNAGRGARKVATETYAKVARPAKAAKAKSTRARKVKRTRRTSKVKAKARAK